ncbi:response regulator transcription factor [Bifidobacterium sp. ESL0784]|uniref:response regulator transcription factor n=1 Tax=Bifidobacterium sp. ESL0784 TaxID=2983231 RepID=UPI0023F61E7F|nr:response regulator transcription factor [Bifidobacterium sp. ESL0784]MDF7641593.1 response regulator transcription factor [Bifidobacterium sp. ESL0784]
MKTAIVDDDPIVCSSLITILEATNATEVLWTANDGETAVTKYFADPANRPDVLLIDIQMPGVDGLEAARRILAKDKAARILFLTTFDDKEYIDQAIALGAKGYLIKQDAASVGPALQAVMAGQVVLGAQVLGKLSSPPSSPTSRKDISSNARTNASATAGERDTRMAASSYASLEGTIKVSDSAFSTLSARERDIVALVAQGLDNHDIAAQLYLSEGTVRNRITDILDKLSLSNRTQLAIAWLNADQH